MVAQRADSRFRLFVRILGHYLDDSHPRIQLRKRWLCFFSASLLHFKILQYIARRLVSRYPFTNTVICDRYFEFKTFILIVYTYYNLMYILRK